MWKKKNLQGCGKSQTALVCQGCCNKEAAGLLKQKFILSQCWKLEVWDQGAGRAGFSQGVSPWRANGCLLSVSSLGSLSACSWVLISSSHKDTSHMGLGPSHMTSFYSSHLFKDPLSKYNHILRFWGSGLQHMDLGEHSATHNMHQNVTTGKNRTYKAHWNTAWLHRADGVREMRAHLATEYPNGCILEHVPTMFVSFTGFGIWVCSSVGEGRVLSLLPWMPAPGCLHQPPQGSYRSGHHLLSPRPTVSDNSIPS